MKSMIKNKNVSIYFIMIIIIYYHHDIHSYVILYID